VYRSSHCLNRPLGNLKLDDAFGRVFLARATWGR
jgi:hypothetical protein